MQKEGWACPTPSKKFHYFMEGRALCGKWLFFGELLPNQIGDDKHPDNCAACRKKAPKITA